MFADTQVAMYGLRSPSNTARGKTTAKCRAMPVGAKTQAVKRAVIPKISKRESPSTVTNAHRNTGAGSASGATVHPQNRCLRGGL
jgi:hypothetical protein